MTSSQTLVRMEAFREPGGPLLHHRQEHTFLSAHTLLPPALTNPVHTMQSCQLLLPL